MWVGEDGSINTNAVENSKNYIGPRLLRRIRGSSNSLNQLYQYLDEYMEYIIESIDESDTSASSNPGEWMPDEVVIDSDAKGSIKDAVTNAVENVPLMWKLDAAWIIQDYINMVLEIREEEKILQRLMRNRYPRQHDKRSRGQNFEYYRTKKRIRRSKRLL